MAEIVLFPGETTEFKVGDVIKFEDPARPPVVIRKVTALTEDEAAAEALRLAEIDAFLRIVSRCPLCGQ